MKLVDFGFPEVCLWVFKKSFDFPGNVCIIPLQILFTFRNVEENKLLWVSQTWETRQSLYMFWGHWSKGLGMWDDFKREVVFASLFLNVARRF